MVYWYVNGCLFPFLHVTVLVTVFSPCVGPAGLTVTVIFTLFSGWLHILCCSFENAMNPLFCMLSTKPKLSHNGSLQRLSGTCPGTEVNTLTVICDSEVAVALWQYITACNLHLHTVFHTVFDHFALRSHLCLRYPPLHINIYRFACMGAKKVSREIY